MSYTYIEHTADIGIHAEGETLESAVESSAEAMLNVMFDTETIDITMDITFGVDAPELALLFIEILNELLSIQDRHSLAIKKLKTMEIKKTSLGYRFIGTAYGEPINHKRHALKTEVKAATYSGLSYKERDNKHVFECVLDV